MEKKKQIKNCIFLLRNLIILILRKLSQTDIQTDKLLTFYVTTEQLNFVNGAKENKNFRRRLY